MRRYKVPEEYREYGDFAYCTSPLVRWSRHRHLIALALSGTNPLLGELDGRLVRNFRRALCAVLLVSTIAAFVREDFLLVAVPAAVLALVANWGFAPLGPPCSVWNLLKANQERKEKGLPLGLAQCLSMVAFTHRDFIALSSACSCLRSRLCDLVQGLLVPIPIAWAASLILQPEFQGITSIPLSLVQITAFLGSYFVIRIWILLLLQSGLPLAFAPTKIEMAEIGDNSQGYGWRVFRHFGLWLLFLLPGYYCILLGWAYLTRWLGPHSDGKVLFGLSLCMPLIALAHFVFERRLERVIRGWSLRRMKTRLAMGETIYRKRLEAYWEGIQPGETQAV